ncbi:hypothetical protein HDU93_007454 [Gonapodya sp. JEL0774]|nr:hypothetical protein HDU93_007454 [Gonapodya sp. JEL0774]
MSVYCGSKFALEGISDAVRRELKLHNHRVEVAVIEPFFANTPIVVHHTGEERLRICREGAIPELRDQVMADYGGEDFLLWSAKQDVASPMMDPQQVVDVITEQVKRRQPRVRSLVGSAVERTLFLRIPERWIDSFFEAESRRRHVRYQTHLQKSTPALKDLPQLSPLPLGDRMLGKVAGECTIVHIMLTDDSAVSSVVASLLSASNRITSIIVNHSTISPSGAAELHTRCSAVNVDFVPCPVLGRPDRAEAGVLGALFSGTAKGVVERILPVLETFTSAQTDLGPDIKAANSFKLILNYHLPVGMEMISEAMCLMDKNGIDRQHLLTFYGFLMGRGLPGYAQTIATDDFKQGMSVTNGQKDLRLILELGKDSGVKLPYAELAMDRMKEAEKRGRGDLDWAVMATVVREENGLPTGLPTE